MTAPHAVILAGGQGERLGGVRKSDLRIGGVSLIDRVMARLSPVQWPILVSVRDETQPILPAGTQAIGDLDEAHGGPLAGLAAAVAALRGHAAPSAYLVTTAVDTPFLPENFVARLLAEIGEAPVAFAIWGGNFYPTSALWRLRDIAELPEQFMAGKAPHGPKTLQQALGGVAVDWTASEPADPFANLNSLADLVALGRRASLL